MPHNLFNEILIFPFLNLLVGIYKLFLLVKLPWAFGFAIIALTVLVRLVLHPFFKQQLQTAKKMQDIKPHLDRLSKKHKADPKKLQAEQMKLYQEAGINPASGCLLMIIQMPVFIALYNTLNVFLHGAAGTMQQINQVLYFPFLKISHIDPSFLGFNLVAIPSKTGKWYYIIIPVVTALLQFFQAKYSTPQITSVPTKKDNDKDKKQDTAEDFQKTMSMQMQFVMPALIGWLSYTFPVGLSLYWNIFSIFSIIQYRQVNKNVEPAVKEIEEEIEEEVKEEKEHKKKK